MSINIDQLKTKIGNRISLLDGTIETEEIISLTLALDNLTQDRIVAVDTPDDLPDLQTDFNSYSFPSGSIFFVKSLGVHVISCKTQWIGLDGRLLRNDGLDIIGMAWGGGNNGKLGDGTTVNKSSPVSIIGGITNWKKISAGGQSHNLGLTDTGIAYAWGGGSQGRLGDGTTVDKSSPVTVIGGITNWVQLSAGDNHSLGITEDGVAYAWGWNVRGQIGDDTLVGKSSPVTVVGGITWSQVIAGGAHSLGLSNGVAYSWGQSTYGQLGDGSTVNKSSPVPVLGNITNWSQLSAGSTHSLGLTDTGIAYAWGRGTLGTLGDGTNVNKSSPVTVIGGLTWSQVSAGSAHSLGLTDTGIAYAWGNNLSGKLGDNTTDTRSSPVTVVGGITNWSQVSAGGSHSSGVTDTGIIYSWGLNSTGQLGDGTTVSKRSPVIVVSGISNWVEVSTANGNAFGLFPQS